MSQWIATYIDFIQSIGFISIIAIVVTLLNRLYANQKKDNFVESVKIRVDD